MKTTPEERKEREESRKIQRAQDAVMIEDIKNALARKHGINRDTRFEHAWRLAWDYGHASGLHEVQAYFDDLAELIKTA